MKCELVSDLIKSIFILIYTLPVYSIPRSFNECHEDFMLHPKDGILPAYTFSWIGILHYEHVETGFRCLTRTPRVVLIHKQFVLANSKDVNNLPFNHKLSSVTIDDYERLETDCGLTAEQIINEERCPRAVIDIPIANVIIHPESSRFRVGHTLAIVKLLSPINSPYALPICLPSINERKRQVTVKQVFLVDYVSLVPINFDVEKKGKKTLQLLSEDECKSMGRNMTMEIEQKNLQVLCTSGCGIRSGSPIVTHSSDGAFEIMGVAIGGPLCTTKKMRSKLSSEPPLYIDVYPYKTWIINVITANLLPHSIPVISANMDHGRRQSLSTAFYTRAGSQRQGWHGRWYSYGDKCFVHRKEFRNETLMFYYEVLQINTIKGTRVNYFLELSAGLETKILCVKLRLPFRKRKEFPTVVGIDTSRINVTFQTKWFPWKFEFVIGMWGINVTKPRLPAYASEFWTEKPKAPRKKLYMTEYDKKRKLAWEKKKEEERKNKTKFPTTTPRDSSEEYKFEIPKLEGRRSGNIYGGEDQTPDSPRRSESGNFAEDQIPISSDKSENNRFAKKHKPNFVKKKYKIYRGKERNYDPHQFQRQKLEGRRSGNIYGGEGQTPDSPRRSESGNFAEDQIPISSDKSENNRFAKKHKPNFVKKKYKIYRGKERNYDPHQFQRQKLEGRRSGNIYGGEDQTPDSPRRSESGNFAEDQIPISSDKSENNRFAKKHKPNFVKKKYKIYRGKERNYETHQFQRQKRINFDQDWF